MNNDIKEILEDYSCIPRIKKLGNYIINLQEENERLKYAMLEKQFPDLNAVEVQIKTERYRISKAIEYIKNCPEYLWSNVNTKSLLNILQGEDNE